MKILHFHDNIQAARRFVVPLVEAERNAGFGSDLVTSSAAPDIDIVPLHFTLNLSNIVRWPSSILRLIDTLRKHRPDVIICHNTRSALLPLLIGKLSCVTVRVYFNHGVPALGYRFFVKWVLTLLEKINLLLAEVVITVSNDMAEEIARISRRSNPTVIHHGSACGIKIESYSPETREKIRRQWREKNGIPLKDSVIVYVGRPVKRKGFELLIRSWGVVLNSRNRTLVLCGCDETDVVKFVGRMPENTLALGYVEDIREILFASDFLVMPSFHEGLSYAVIEAMSYGLVVIVNDIPGMGGLVTHNKSGYLIQGNDMKSYDQTIDKLERDRNVCRIIGDQAKKESQNFSRDLFMPKYIDFLRALEFDKVSRAQ